MDELFSEIKQLEKLIDAKSQGYVQECEMKLAKICCYHDPRIIKEFAVLFSDDCEDDLMWSIIHCIEDFEDEVYVENVLSVLPIIYEKSPMWASILIIRITNNPNSLICLKRCLSRMQDKQRVLGVATYTANKWREQASAIKEVFQIS